MNLLHETIHYSTALIKHHMEMDSSSLELRSNENCSISGNFFIAAESEIHSPLRGKALLEQLLGSAENRHELDLHIKSTPSPDESIGNIAIERTMFPPGKLFLRNDVLMRSE